MNTERFTAALSVLALAIAGLLVATPAGANPGTLAVPDTATVQLGATSVSIMVLHNDTLPIGPSSLEVVVAPAHGTASVNLASADWPIVYTPTADYVGLDTLMYRVTDGDGATSDGAGAPTETTDRHQLAAPRGPALFFRLGVRPDGPVHHTQGVSPHDDDDLHRHDSP